MVLACKRFKAEHMPKASVLGDT